MIFKKLLYYCMYFYIRLKRWFKPKAVLLCPLALTSCFEIGDFFSYAINQDRSNGLVSDSTITLEVIDVVDDVLTFEARIFILPIIGLGRTKVVEKQIPKNLFTQESLEEIRNGRIIEDPDFRLSYAGTTGLGCDLLRIDQIPDTDEFQNMVIIATFCQTNVPMLDVSFDAQGFFIQIGYDRT